MNRVKPFKGFPKKSIKVFGQEWEVHYVKGLMAEESVFGATSESKRAILIDADQSPESASDTLMHEVIHAMLAMSSVELDDKTEEALCRTLAPAFIDLVRNNKLWF
jgi:hypothetical protein